MLDKYFQFFENLLCYKPYNYQEKQAEIFLNYRSSIINAPTGSGKTLSVIAPFLFCWKKWKDGEQNAGEYPRKLIYSLPLRTLANSLYKDIKVLIDNKFSNYDIKVTIQTGEYPEDPFFEGDIIFTTIDQTLSNALGIPLSLPNKLANINAGAIFSSYLVFDEIHLLDPERALSTTIILLSKLKDIVPFTIMTATLSSNFIENVAKYLDAEMIFISDLDYKNFSFVKNKAKKQLHVSSNNNIVDIVRKKHKDKTMVICNTVDRAIEIYKKLKDENKLKDSDIICIHSRFFPEDRKEKEKKIISAFGKNRNNKKSILVTTQIVEVGLDISSDLMITEVSPINSFIQRIGRCARWGGNGDVYITKPDEYLPYKKELCEKTWEELNKKNKGIIDFNLSQELIENILKDEENKIFENIKTTSSLTWNEILNSWLSTDKSKSRELIRDVKSINVVLLSPDDKAYSLYEFESISMNPNSLKYKIEQLETENPVCMILKESNFIDEETVNSDLKNLEPIEDMDEIIYENIIALNSNIIGYSSEYGLDFLGENTGIKSKKLDKKDKIYSVKYYFDTYEEHINWMIKYYENNLKELYSFFVYKMKDKIFKNYNFEDIVKLMIIFHDYGKLNKKWQQIVKEYQSKKDKKEVKDFVAHTDYDSTSEDDINLIKQIGKKPDHSGIGAFVFFNTLIKYLKLTPNDEEGKIITKSFSTAIMRHHSALSKNIPAFEIEENAVNLIQKLINLHKINNLEFEKLNLGFNCILTKFKGTSSGSIVINFKNVYESFIYYVFVRILRLADQHSFDYNDRKYQKEMIE